MKRLSVTIKISDGEREESIQCLVRGDLLSDRNGRLTDGLQDQAVFMVSSCFTDVYKAFVKGDENGNPTCEEGRSKER